MIQWTLETVRTSIGCCHKIGPLHGGIKPTYACVYDDGNQPQRPNQELLSQARLIAAAPELLEACKFALADCNANIPCNGSMLEAVIDRAERAEGKE